MRITILFTLFLSFVAHAEIHTWVDENGKKHFSDKLPDHMRHKAKTLDYSSTSPTTAERDEALRIYEKSKEHANGISLPNRNKVNRSNSNVKTNTAKENKHLTRNQKIKQREENKRKACDAYVEAKRCLKEAERPGGHMNKTCATPKRPSNCFEIN